MGTWVVPQVIFRIIYHPGLQTLVNTLNETMIGRPDIIFWIEIHEFILVNDGIFKHEGPNQNISGILLIRLLESPACASRV